MIEKVFFLYITSKLLRDRADGRETCFADVIDSFPNYRPLVEGLVAASKSGESDLVAFIQESVIAIDKHR